MQPSLFDSPTTGSAAPRPLRVKIHVDGGARGNPGPAGAGVVIRDAADGQILHAAGYFLGSATNNVAEYTGLLRALETALQLGATEAQVCSDSELMVKQLNGVYRVKNEGLRPLFAQAQALRGRFRMFDIRHVYREQNKDADALVNKAIDARRNVEDASR